VHGVAKRDTRVEYASVLALDSTLDNLLGFERAPPPTPTAARRCAVASLRLPMPIVFRSTRTRPAAAIHQGNPPRRTEIGSPDPAEDAQGMPTSTPLRVRMLADASKAAFVSWAWSTVRSPGNASRCRVGHATGAVALPRSGAPMRANALS